MRANEFITERKRKRKKSRRAFGGYFYPGFGYGDNSSGEGDGGGGESMYESAIDDLVKELPSLSKHKYDTMDRLLKKIASKHKISDKALERLFTKKFNKSPSNWLKNKLDETSNEIDIEDEVNKFAEWASNILNIQNPVKIELSMDTEEAQTNHHTGGHVMGSDTVWVYANNRNLVDMLRTVFHELVHVRQGELNMIDAGDSYPGSPIEAMADMLAGKYIKIYGEKNNHIFQ
jgi:AraC-like DNA-binding protein